LAFSLRVLIWARSATFSNRTFFMAQAGRQTICPMRSGTKRFWHTSQGFALGFL